MAQLTPIDHPICCLMSIFFDDAHRRFTNTTILKLGNSLASSCFSFYGGVVWNQLRSSYPLAVRWFIASAMGCWGCSAHNEPADSAARSGGSASTLASSGGFSSNFGTGGTSGSASGGAPADSENGLPVRAWRLSHDQYARSVYALLGVQPNMDGFSPESGNGVYSNFASTALVNEDLADNYLDLAVEIAETIPTEQLRELTTCNLGPDCRDAFINELGSVAFRSPLPVEVATRLGGLFDSAAAESGVEMGYRAALAGMISSPLFLYRKELGPLEDTTQNNVELTEHQLAEFLSYSLLGSLPPVWLAEMAALGTLKTNLLSAVEQLMTEPAFQAELTQFLEEWLEIRHFGTVEKFEDSFPGFEEAKPWMRAEFEAFVAQNGGPDQELADLLLAPVPSVSPELTAFYLSDPSAPPLEETQRLGVLALGTTLASHAKSYLTSPTQRGTFVRKRFFCQEITLPPNFTPPPLSETESKGLATTTRELYEQHQSDPSCARCHELTDNIGFALEAFDGAGRFRTLDSTQGPSMPLDLETELTDSDVDRPLESAQDLARALAESTLVRQCFARQAFRFYFGKLESDATATTLSSRVELMSEHHTIAELVLGLVSGTETLLRKRETQN